MYTIQKTPAQAGVFCLEVMILEKYVSRVAVWRCYASAHSRADALRETLTTCFSKIIVLRNGFEHHFVVKIDDAAEFVE